MLLGPLSTCSPIPIPLRAPRRPNCLPRSPFTTARIFPRTYTTIQDYHSRRFFGCKPCSITPTASPHSPSYRHITHLFPRPGRGHNSFIGWSGAHITVARYISLPPVRNTQLSLRHHSSPIRKPLDTSSELPSRFYLAYSASSSRNILRSNDG